VPASTGSVNVISLNSLMVLLVGNAAIKNMGMEGWQQLTLSVVAILQQVNG